MREVAETAVFEAESEIERHRVLYSKERQKRKRLGDKLFYRQLEQRLKNSAADSTSERIQWLFDEQQHKLSNHQWGEGWSAKIHFTRRVY